MKISNKAAWCAVLAVALVSAAAQAQTWSAEQQAAWAASESTWERDLNKDSGWINDATHASVSAWGMDYPAPRGRDSVHRWAQHGQSTGTMLMYDLAPLAIVVAGDTALVHYYYTTASKTAEGKNETTHGRCSDTLVRDGGKWVFLGWSCSDEPKPR
jgi:hypothetical protein